MDMYIGTVGGIMRGALDAKLGFVDCDDFGGGARAQSRI